MENTSKITKSSTQVANTSKLYTFLFTDIEGSTKLWEQFPEKMSHSLQRHDEILRKAIETHNGKVFKTIGDAFCAVFPTATDGLLASVQAQQEIHQELIGDTFLPLRIRMGVHTGIAEERDNDYFGQTLNHVARIQGTGHGDQILLSSETKVEIDSSLPSNIKLRDLGKHRLRDVEESKQIFQVLLPETANNFTPIKSLSPRPTNLPAQLTSFVGRDEEVTDIYNKLQQNDVRLLTIVGPGGVGKTRLSLAVAERFRDEFQDGVFFIALDAFTTDIEILEEIFFELDVETVGTHPLKTLQRFLREKQILFVLDNFEQVLDSAHILTKLLASAPQLKILTTSREALSVYGEQLYQAPPMKLPDLSRLPGPEKLIELESIALFVERATARHQKFQLESANAHGIAEICIRLDGLPLAIELVASRIQEFNISELLEQLTNRLDTIAKGPRDLPARQQTIRGAIEWSYDLLTPEQRIVFARLGVFLGKFTASAASIVTAESELLETFVEKSLLYREVHNDTIYYSFLGVLREYALERLAERNETNQYSEKHAEYFQTFIKEIETKLLTAEQGKWFGQLEALHDNFRATLRWAFAQNRIRLAGEVVSVLWRLWSVQSHLSEGLRWMKQILEHSDNLPKTLHIKLLIGAGRITLFQDEFLQSEQYLWLGLQLAEDLQDKESHSLLLLHLGENQLIQRKYLEAERYFSDALVMFVESGDQPDMARCLDNLGNIARYRQNYRQAVSFLQESLKIKRESGGSTEGLAITLNSLAEALRAQGNLEESEPYYEESLQLYRELDIPPCVAIVCANLGQVESQRGKYDEATKYFAESLDILRSGEEKLLIAQCLAGMASVQLHTEKLEQAAKNLIAVASLLEATGTELDPIDQSAYEETKQKVQEKLGQAEWDAQIKLIRAFPLKQIISQAID